ncbi:hypothetical protein D3C76_481350 [compost metagenome]
MIVPSTDIFSPGFTTTRSPCATSSGSIIVSMPFLFTLVVLGARSSSALMEDLVFSIVLTSR